ncbi:helix-turn-helix domain-containing protein [Mycobacterium timonense]|uniref:HTH tetR-type domain-containing protein n=1 Tax=Mycobacterium timonense TaxID=701043 RepID=A0A7I9ZEG2_9MYCO|nr:hypothetical protein MTIM_52690 [Mycobacterium timonense]
MATARRLFADAGYDKTSVRDIAAGAGVDPALIRHYFGSKAELFRSTMGWPFDPADISAHRRRRSRGDRRAPDAGVLHRVGAAGLARFPTGDPARRRHPR